MVEWSTSTPRSAMSSSTWRVLSGYATYQRTPMRMTSLGKWAPLKLTAIVALPHDGPLLTGEGAYLKSPQIKIATKPLNWHQIFEATLRSIFSITGDYWRRMAHQHRRMPLTLCYR